MSPIKKFRNLLAEAGFDGFLIGLLSVIGIAYFLPGPGVYNGVISLSKIANWGVMFVFFFYGLRLSPQKLKAGISNWKLHSVVHTSTFLIFPLLVLLGIWLFSNEKNQLIWLSVFFLSTLPSTVTSAVVMVSIARGNVPAAIFNASISSLLGVFITPLWMGIFLSGAAVNFEMWHIVGKLILQVIAPIVLGILLNKYWGAYAEKHRVKLRYFDQSVVLIIVYTSFCSSFTSSLFSNFNLNTILVMVTSMLGLFIFMFGVIYSISKVFRFTSADRITALFCGSQKSLMQGSVMAKVLFPNSTATGVVLLSVMVYHALQLLITGVIAQQLAKKYKG